MRFCQVKSKVMVKKKKDSIELHFYEIPQRDYVLALLGEEAWMRNYGHDGSGVCFHNLTEVGYCRKGTGELILDGEVHTYQPAMVSVIPPNFPHMTVNRQEDGPSFWEFIFFDPQQLAAEMCADDELGQMELLEKMNRGAVLLHERDNEALAIVVRMIIEEMRAKAAHYRDSVHGLALALATEIVRLGEREAGPGRFSVSNRNTENVANMQIVPAVEYVKEHYSEPSLRVDGMAGACHMSETHFRRVFETCMNMSPVDYVNLVRIQKACGLMKKSNDSMDAVARKVGFATTSTFNRNFKKYLDTSPYQWKINPGNYERKLQGYTVTAEKSGRQ